MTMFTNRIGLGAFRSVQHVPSLRSSWTTASAVLGNILTMLLDWQERARERHQLLSLSDGALKDFGRSRADAAGEGDKPFWRA